MRLSLRAGAQLVVVTLRDAGGESPKDIAVRTLNAWAAGRRSAVLLVLMNPRKLYIQPGTDLADVLDEPTASAICASVVAPKLRAGDKAGALRAGLEAIADKVAAPEPVRQAFTPEKENPTPEELQSKLDAMVDAVQGKGDGENVEAALVEDAPADFGSNGLLPVLGVVVLALATGGGVWGLVRASQRKCHQCGERMRRERRVLEHPTYSSSGRGELHFSCRSCGAEFTEAIVLPMLVESSSSSSDFGSSSSDSSSSSSSDSSSSSSDGSGGGGSSW